MTSNNSFVCMSVIVNEYFSNNEPSILSSLSLITSKYEDKSPSFCVTNLIIVDVGSTNLFCSISTPDDVDILAS